MSLLDWHRPFRDAVAWRLCDLGVEIEGVGVERTPGEPATVMRIWNRFAKPINAAARFYSVPSVLVVATIATETRGQDDAVRIEPGYRDDDSTPNRISIGVMQTLISTARAAMGDPAIGRRWLLEPENSIEAGTRYISKQERETGFDPPLVAAAYNAGGLYYQRGKPNRWKLRQFPIGRGDHLDRFVKWFNDAAAMLAAHQVKPEVTLTEWGF